MTTESIWFSEKKFCEVMDGVGLTIVLEMNFSELQEERTRFAHHALLDVEVGELLERTNFFRSEFGDAFVNGDGLGEETVADKNLGETFKIVDGLKGFALAHVEFADGHQGDLVAGLKF